MNISPIHNGAIEDYFENGFSYADLSRKYGRHETTCRKVISAYKIQHQIDHQGVSRVRKIVPTNAKSGATGKPISMGHSAIGMRIARHMQRNNLRATEFGMLLDPMKSPSIINMAVIGAYDWSLSDVQRLCLFFEVPFDRLMTMEAEHAYA